MWPRRLNDVAPSVVADSFGSEAAFVQLEGEDLSLAASDKPSASRSARANVVYALKALEFTDSHTTVTIMFVFVVVFGAH